MKTLWASVSETRLVLETGAYGGEATPVPIPNTAVKLSCGDDTGNPGKVAQCRIVIIQENHLIKRWFLFIDMFPVDAYACSWDTRKYK